MFYTTVLIGIMPSLAFKRFINILMKTFVFIDSTIMADSPAPALHCWCTYVIV